MFKHIVPIKKKIGVYNWIMPVKELWDMKKYSFAMIKSILERGLDNLRDDDHFFEEKKLPKHKNIRGGKYYE